MPLFELLVKKVLEYVLIGILNSTRGCCQAIVVSTKIRFSTTFANMSIDSA